MKQSPVVTLCEVRDRIEGDIVAALLRARGIPSLIQPIGPLSAELVRGTNGWKGPDDRVFVLVPQTRLEEARQILAEAKEAGRLLERE